MSLPTPNIDTTCLVTGASSGIGAELARGLARRGHGITLVGRREERLSIFAEELASYAGMPVEQVTCDLADEKSRQRMIDAVGEFGHDVDVLVNCAGLGSGGMFKDLDVGRELDIVRVNIEAMVHLCHTYAPQMAPRGRGAILNVASIAGYAPIPRQATYAASKAFVVNFTHALHAEMKRSGVAVTTLSPGPTHTEFGEASGPRVQDVMEHLPGFLGSNADEVAETGLRALAHGKRTAIPGAINKVNVISGYLTPRAMELAMMDRFYPVRE